MSLVHYRIAELTDAENVYQFETKLKFSNSTEDMDSIESKMQIWDSSYRMESLEHYFKLGWSFLALNNKNEVVGFFLGQPLLFVDKQTQTLWIEYLSAINVEISTELIDIAYRLSREKHFQRVLLSAEIQKMPLTKSLPFQNWSRETILLKTTK